MVCLLSLHIDCFTREFSVGVTYCTRLSNLTQQSSMLHGHFSVERASVAYRGQRAILVRRHCPGPAQGCIHDEPVQGLIRPGLPVLIELVWQVLYASGAFKVDILLACRSGPSTHAAAAASLYGEGALKPFP